MSRPAVFLDRDGTMIHEVQFLRRYEDLRWYPSTIDAIRLLNRAGFLVCVTTNQSGVGRGLFSDDDVRRLHLRMSEALEAARAHVHAWFYCPHHPEAALEPFRQDCECRKPRAGMIRSAAGQFAIDLARSFVVGDRMSDVGLAKSAGARAVLVRTGYGESTVQEHGGRVPGAALVADNLMQATSWMLAAEMAPATGTAGQGPA